jgi:hypothetical protein
MRRSFIFLLLVAVPLFGCSKTFIPNTDVEDTSDNRKVIMFCERYRHAVEEKNVAELLKIASPSYFEDGGNTKPEDDYDYAGLKDYLTTTFQKTTGIRYEIRYRRITYTEQQHIWVDFTYAASYKIPGLPPREPLAQPQAPTETPAPDEWHHRVADDRLDLVRDGDGYKIVSGM